jgi:hypothetical protein
MSIPNSKATLKQWCKRKLGYPVIDINIDEDQCDDRIDEALQYFYTFQYGGMQRVYLKHKVTQEDVDRANVDTEETASDGGQVTNTLAGAVVSGATTVTLTDATSFPATGSITIAADGTNAAETVTYSAKTGNALTTTALANDHDSGSTVTSVNQVTWSIGQAYLTMPDSVQSVLRVLPFSDRGNLNMFDVRYQLRLNDLYDFSSESVIHYQMTMWQLDLLDMILVGEKPIQFNAHQNRLYINMDWGDDIEVGEYIIIEAYRKLDPTTWTDIYNDLWLKKYATALIKRQWGENLSKFNGVTMLGGVTMNGLEIFQAALAEIELLEEQSKTTWEEPLLMDIG